MKSILHKERHAFYRLNNAFYRLILQIKHFIDKQKPFNDRNMRFIVLSYTKKEIRPTFGNRSPKSIHYENWNYYTVL